MTLHRPSVPTLVASLLASACALAQSPPRPADCRPLQTADANAPSQRPAFSEQTRACAAPQSSGFAVEVVAEGLVSPWAVEPLPDGALLVTEKPGRMRIVSRDGRVSEPLRGLPPVEAGGQGGLLDVALGPGFAEDRMIYWSYTEPRERGNGTSVARGRLSADRGGIEQVQVVLRTMPSHGNHMHYGSRLAFGADGMLYVTLGERSDRATRQQAQDLGSHFGKILRIAPDGSIPPDNPYVGQAGARPEIWSSGHRNVQAAAFDSQGRLWAVEHGARGGDEVNLIAKGRNYGWPVIAYGVEYSGAPITGGNVAKDGMQQPVYYWDPVIAPSGAQWYTGDAFPQWRGNLFIGGMKARALVRLVFDGAKVSAEEHLLGERNQRVRDVRQGPDGALYAVTDHSDGALWRITPKR